MLSDQGADLVMAEIEYLTKYGLKGWADNYSHATANAMLNHLTELHRRRDAEIHEYVYFAVIKPHAWYGEQPHPCIPTLLAM